MARREALRYEELAEAAQRLKDRGDPVSVTALLRELGGGSYATIYKYRDRWLHSPEGAAAKEPSGPPVKALEVIEQGWAELVRASEEKVQAIHAEASEVIARETEARRAAEAECERLRNELAAAEEKRHEIDGQLRTLAGEHSRQSALLAAEQATRLQLEARVGDLVHGSERQSREQATVNERLAAVQDELRASLIERDSYRQRLETALLEVEKQAGTIGVLEQKIGQVEQDREATQARLESANADRANLTLEAQSQRVAYDRVREELIQVQTQALGDCTALLKVIEERLPPPPSSRSGRNKRGSQRMTS